MSGSLASRVDGLYRDVVTDPGRWTDDAYAEWLETISIDGLVIDRARARALRRAVRIAMKLQKFWVSPQADRYRDEASWEARVDLAVGVPAWRPGLELAELELEADPSPEAFTDVGLRFRVVNGAPWMDGIDYDEWCTRGRSNATG